jgi:hypothetical protein
LKRNGKEEHDQNTKRIIILNTRQKDLKKVPNWRIL